MSDGNLRKLFKQNLSHFDWQAIETGSTGRGIPDANYCYNGIEGWIEYKQTSTNAVGIRPEQVAWIERRVRHGGRVFIAIREIRPANRLHIALDFLHFYRGEKVRELKDKGLKCKGYYFMCIGGPKEWNWDIIGRSLLDKKLTS